MGRTAQDREIRSLERRLRAESEKHRAMLLAKNEELEAARNSNVVLRLAPLYPALKDFLAELHRLSEAADARPGRNLDKVGRSANEPTPLDSASNTRRERGVAGWANHRIEKLTEDIRDRLTPRGPIVEEPRPQCWEPDCPTRASHQAWDRTTCISCGTPFGRYRPHDLTKKLRGKPKRCWTRDCPMYGRQEACSHVEEKEGAA